MFSLVLTTTIVIVIAAGELDLALRRPVCGAGVRWTGDGSAHRCWPLSCSGPASAVRKFSADPLMKPYSLVSTAGLLFLCPFNAAS